MFGKRKSKNKTDNEPPAAADIFARTNRGMLLDIFVFVLNLVLMWFLTDSFINLVRQASGGDTIAGFAMFLFCLGIFILPPLGATLKRRHFHRRLQTKGKTSARGEDFLGGCFFNPIFYFCLHLVVISAINAFIFQFFYGDKRPEDGAVFVSLVLLGLVLTIFQTAIVYRYFSPPKREPKPAFLRDPRSEILGDACIFLNMILFQILWNVLAMSVPGRPPNVSIVSEIFFRLFFISFAALLIYFPPRIFYLAEDIRRPRAWLTTGLANLPLIFRLLFDAA